MNRSVILDSLRRNLLWQRQLPASTDQWNMSGTVRALLALHATDPATVHLSVAARVQGVTPQRVTSELYAADKFVKVHAMRRTVFVVERETVPLLHAAVGTSVAASERRAVLRLLDSAMLTEDWLERVTESVTGHLSSGQQLSGKELTTLEPRLKQLVTAPGRAKAKSVSVGSRILGLLAMEQRLERGAPTGSWRSNQVRWRLARTYSPVPTNEARARLVREYLSRFGPATLVDVQWWTGLSKRAVSEALTGIDCTQIRLSDGRPGLTLVDQVDASAPEARGARLLPALDPTVMGWKDRSWFLDESMTSELVDRTGNVGPTLWWQGNVVGGWGQDHDGRVRWELLTSVPARAVKEIRDAAEGIQQFLGMRSVRPRFRTALEKRISTSLCPLPEEEART